MPAHCRFEFFMLFRPFGCFKTFVFIAYITMVGCPQSLKCTAWPNDPTTDHRGHPSEDGTLESGDTAVAAGPLTVCNGLADCDKRLSITSPSCC